ncbi:MAG: 16S rRNA (guanine(966)-N(2))-methyltransferase RsmD [Chloroflexi bacterium]|nr:16S rRNA (guanine(966)-N(2))-methyltransferase RsmD [Chloroflexota bacterium]
MRVVGGQARGIPLKSLRARGLRPTTDRVRAAIFSMLEARAVTMVRVLDLYAGTGALGIEALSRGAAWTDFVERAPRLCAVIRENLQQTGFQDRAAVHPLPVSRAIQVLPGSYDLIFMDPPYAEAASLGPTITALQAAGRAVLGTHLIVEHGTREALEIRQAGLRRVQAKTHGDTAVTLYAVEGGLA